ncbi:Rab-like protein 6 [Homalodisca vitripennis]|nr:Rab-like protein 6 [Homalodisca vitripennis]
MSPITASLDPTKIRSQSVPEVRLTAPPAQPFPTNTKIFSKPVEIVQEKIQVSSNGIHSVEEFMPDGDELDKSFLDDSPTNNKGHTKPDPADSDSEAETGNPLVAGFQDDLDPDDIAPPSPLPLHKENSVKSNDSDISKQERSRKKTLSFPNSASVAQRGKSDTLQNGNFPFFWSKMIRFYFWLTTHSNSVRRERVCVPAGSLPSNESNRYVSQSWHAFCRV